MRVEVVYALEQEQSRIALEVGEGARVNDALSASGLLKRFPDLDLGQHRIGIWGRVVSPDTLLRDLDRIEIYRPLRADPKLARRRRAAQGK